MTQRFTAYRGLLVACLLALAGVSLAQETVRVRVLRDEPLGPISPLAITGFNYGVSMQVALYRDAFAALNVQAVRFPPGNDADNNPLNQSTLDAFKVQWELLDRPEILLVANFFEGAEHAVWVASYLEGIGMPVRHWTVGNEPDLYRRNRMNESWTPDVYCDRFRAFAAALKEQNPDNVITGPAVSGSRPSGVAFLREVLRLCGDVIDVLTWHVYPTDGTWDDAAALATSKQVTEEIQMFREWLRDPQYNPLGYERDIGLGITEFGLSWRTDNYNHLEDMPAALWLADVLGRVASEGVERGYYFALQGLGGHGLIDNAGWVRPTYFVYRMVADFTGEAVKVEVEPAALNAYAALAPDGYRVLLVNMGTEDVQAEIDLAGEFEVETLSGTIFDEFHGTSVFTQTAESPLTVPARSIVYLRETSTTP
jgi:hypothetical protein